MMMNEYQRMSSVKKVDNYGVRFHRYRMILGATNFNIPELETEVKKDYIEWKKSPDTYVLDPDYIFITFCVNIRSGTKQEWDFLFDRYSTTTSIPEKDNILFALTCTKDPALFSHYLNATFSDKDSKIRKQDIQKVFSNVVGNTVGYKLAKDYLFTNIEKINNLFGEENKNLASFMSDICRYVVTEEEMKEVQEFIAKNDKYFKSSKIIIDQGVARMKDAVQWHKDHDKEISECYPKE
ncbi:hypothetical protein WDU94_009930 [Cyamophila willieti]